MADQGQIAILGTGLIGTSAALALVVVLFIAAARFGGGYLPEVTAWVTARGV